MPAFQKHIRGILLVALLASTVVAGPAAQAQSLLQRLEQRLGREIVPEPLPEPAPPAPDSALLGIRVARVTELAVRLQGLVVRQGALITSIQVGSPADRAGLPLGGVIVAADGQRIDSPDDLVEFIRAAHPGQEVELTYYQRDRLFRKSVRLAPSQAVPAPVNEADPPAARPASDQALLALEKQVELLRLQVEELSRRLAELEARLDAEH